MTEWTVGTSSSVEAEANVHITVVHKKTNLETKPITEPAWQQFLRYDPHGQQLQWLLVLTDFTNTTQYSAECGKVIIYMPLNPQLRL